jgi:ABC-type transport system substrate-binding protein
VAGTPGSANEQVASVVRAQMAAANAGPPKRGGTLTAAVQNDWLTFDPILNSADSTAAFQVYDPLFFFLPDESGTWSVQGGLVEKWELGQDAVVFKLRQGVKFHDGSDWNAEVSATTCGQEAPSTKGASTARASAKRSMRAFARSASYDPKEPAAGYRDVQRLVFDNALYGFLWTQNWNWVLNKRVAGFQPARPSLWDFRRMWTAG